MSLFSASLSIGSTAINAYKSYVAVPELFKVGTFSAEDFQYFRIFPENYSLKLSAIVSKQVLVNITDNKYANKKEYVFDNVAPGPRRWSIQGYVGEMNDLSLIGIVAKITPVLATFKNATLSLRLNKRLRVLEEWFYSREILRFKDRTGKLYDVLIEDLEFTPTAEVQNKIALTIVLQEINISQSSLYVASVPKEGTVDGKGFIRGYSYGTPGTVAADGTITPKGARTESYAHELLRKGNNGLSNVMENSWNWAKDLFSGGSQ